jgi:Type II CAAX prenyl endopeptidase Rce1-like
LGISVLAFILSAAFEAPVFARGLVAIAAQDSSWIWGYHLLAYDRHWVSISARFSSVRSGVLWACAAEAIAIILILMAAEKILTWFGFELPPLPAPSFLLGGQGWLPATFLMVAIVGPAAEELTIRGLLLDWLRQKMSVWRAILVSAWFDCRCISFSLALPMPLHVAPLVAHRLPLIGDPMCLAMLDDPAARYPLISTAVPFPVSRCPNIAVTRAAHVLDAWRRRRHVSNDFGCHCRSGSEQ